VKYVARLNQMHLFLVEAENVEAAALVARGMANALPNSTLHSVVDASIPFELPEPPTPGSPKGRGPRGGRPIGGGTPGTPVVRGLVKAEAVAA